MRRPNGGVSVCRATLHVIEKEAVESRPTWLGWPDKPLVRAMISQDDFEKKRQTRLPTSFENEFHRLIGQLVHAHARFDFSVSLQLSWLGPHCAVDIAKHLDPRRVQFIQRLHRLRKIVLIAFAPGGDEVLAKFRAWFKRAESAKALRNSYSHGRWGVPGKHRFTETTTLADATPLLCFLPLGWDMSPDRVDQTIELTLDEFAKQVADAEAIFGDYFAMCEEYIQYVIRRKEA